MTLRHVEYSSFRKDYRALNLYYERWQAMTTTKIRKPHLIRRSWLHGESHDTIQFGLHNGKNKNK